jgi:UDP-glucose 4-epimerase
MRIAVTGGSGRIGQAVIKLVLSEGHSAVNIDQVDPAQPEDRSGVSFVRADLTCYEAVEQAFRECDAVIHMGAIPSPGLHPDHIVHNNNVVGSYNALRAAAELGIDRVCQASSVNATGLSYSRRARFDYFPLDEKHPTYNEDPYSLSKWICEQQGDSFARRYETMSIASLRFSWVIEARPAGSNDNIGHTRNLWGYTILEAAARACLLGVTADFKGHEVFYITAPDTLSDVPSLELAQDYFPTVPVQGDLSGNRSFFDCTKAERLLGWMHNGS